MAAQIENPRYWHRWYPSHEAGVPVDRCGCGVMRNADGSNDKCICSATIAHGQHAEPEVEK